MCISAIETIGDAMNCKGSMLSTIDCNDSAWCDSRDEVTETKCTDVRVYEEDLSSRYGDLLDTSISSSIHRLLHDSSSHRLDPETTPRSVGCDIFRCRSSPPECSSQSLPFNQLNRCSAWVQDDFSFESEYPREDSISRVRSVRLVHWEDRLSDSETLDMKNDYGIFRQNELNLKTNNELVGSIKLRRCSAWSLDDSSSLRFDDSFSGVRRRESELRKNQADMVHWDELVQGRIE